MSYIRRIHRSTVRTAAMSEIGVDSPCRSPSSTPTRPGQGSLLCGWRSHEHRAQFG